MRVYPNFYKALAIVFALIVLFAVGIPALFTTEAPDANTQHVSETPSVSLSDIETLTEETLSFYRGEAPAWFSHKVLEVNSYQDLLLANDGKLVSFTSSQDLSTLSQTLQDELEQHGWTVVDSGVEECWTCIKESGTVTWGCVQIASVPAGNAVVVSVC